MVIFPLSPLDIYLVAKSIKTNPNNVKNLKSKTDAKCVCAVSVPETCAAFIAQTNIEKALTKNAVDNDKKPNEKYPKS